MLSPVVMELIIRKLELLSKVIVFHAWLVTCAIGVAVPSYLMIRQSQARALRITIAATDLK